MAYFEQVVVVCIVVVVVVVAVVVVAVSSSASYVSFFNRPAGSQRIASEGHTRRTQRHVHLEVHHPPLLPPL